MRLHPRAFALAWRLPATLLCLVLAACATQPGRKPGDAPASTTGTTDVGTPPALMPVPPPDQVPFAPPTEPVAAPLPASPWDRLRARLAMPGCEYSPAVQRRAQQYTRGPQRFAETLKRALPFLQLVLEELERVDLPGEFALLPYLESHYEPVVSRGNMPAGMWQIMPATARSIGLAVDAGYDGRLDAWASTMAAVDLLKRYQDEFGDWRLVDMAFNAGEYRVKKLLRGNGDAELTREQIDKLALSPITHDHLAKLLALGCVINDPARFGVTLPEPDAADRLVRVPLDAPIDLRLAARLAGVPEKTIARYNAGHKQSRMSGSAPRDLLLPESAAGTFRDRYAQLTPAAWSTWQAIKLKQPLGVAELAGKAAVPIELIGAANSATNESSLSAGRMVFLPAALASSVGTRIEVTPVAAPEADADGVVVVRAGDSLWLIAKRHRVALADLREWNGLGDRATLKPGQRLRIRAATGD